MQFLRLLVVGLGILAAAPEAAADYYQGKTLTVIVGYAPGGGVDTTARAVTRHLGRFIPGNPAVTVQNMEGAAGIVSLNHLVRRVAPDGLTLGIPGRSWFVEGIVKRQGAAFDPVALTYIGSPGSVTSAAYLRAATGIKTFEALKASPKPVTFGALGAGTHTATVPNLLAAVGAPIRVVLGYVSTARILLALEQGRSCSRPIAIRACRSFATSSVRSTGRCSIWCWQPIRSACRWSARPEFPLSRPRSCARRSWRWRRIPTTKPMRGASNFRSAARSRAASSPT
jgi:hypothetical protein